MFAWARAAGVYRDWRDRVYPRGAGAAIVAAPPESRLSTIEINASFYRLPLPATYERWSEQVPAGFPVRREDEPLPDARATVP
ncbi:MAG: DUF72 domain-containing protein [Actinomycetota bacterium]